MLYTCNHISSSQLHDVGLTHPIYTDEETEVEKPTTCPRSLSVSQRQATGCWLWGSGWRTVNGAGRNQGQAQKLTPGSHADSNGTCPFAGGEKPAPQQVDSEPS